MRAYIVTTIIGTFGVDERNKILAFKPFLKDPAKAAEKLRLSEVELIEEERQVRDELGRKKFREFIFSYRKSGAKHIEPNNKAEKYIKENLRKLAADYKVVKDQSEFNQLLTRINIELTKVKIKRAIGRDSLIIQTNRTIEELDKSINIFMERLREFYGLHFPEMDRAIDSHEKFAKMVEKFGTRDKMEVAELEEFKQNSMGMDLKEEDVKIVQLIASKILELYKLREDLTKYLEKLLKELAPNFSEIASPIIAARLISKAGGLEKLAKMPSSTIQLLGAEKALFRFLHGEGRSPRFGIIFSHPFVMNAPEKLKGKVARLIASKLSMAAKMDFYSKEYRGEKYKQEIQAKMKEIMKSQK